MEETRLLHVMPADGIKVRDPDTKLHLPPEGQEVPNTKYWRDRIRTGDVVVVSPTLEDAAEIAADAQEE